VPDTAIARDAWPRQGCDGKCRDRRGRRGCFFLQNGSRSPIDGTPRRGANGLIGVVQLLCLPRPQFDGSKARRSPEDSLWSVGLFRCESILLRSNWVMVVMDVFTRRIIERADPCGASICRMFNQISAGKSLPRHLSSDHDPLFRFHRWLANLRILEVEEIKSISYVPVSHPFVERLIGTIRR
jgi:hypothetical protein